eukprot:sb/3473618/
MSLPKMDLPKMTTDWPDLPEAGSFDHTPRDDGVKVDEIISTPLQSKPDEDKPATSNKPAATGGKIPDKERSRNGARLVKHHTMAQITTVVLICIVRGPVPELAQLCFVSVDLMNLHSVNETWVCETLPVQCSDHSSPAINENRVRPML